MHKQRAPEAKFMDSGARAIYGRIKIDEARKVLSNLCIANVFTAVSDVSKLILGVGPIIFQYAQNLLPKA